MPLYSEINRKRQATQHSCLPSLLGDGDKSWNEIVYVREKILCTGPTRAAKAELKFLIYGHNKPNEPNKKGPLSFVLIESPFTSVSTVSRAHPSSVSPVMLLHSSEYEAQAPRQSHLPLRHFVRILGGESMWHEWSLKGLMSTQNSCSLCTVSSAWDRPWTKYT
jgi:hypothetical protein